MKKWEGLAVNKDCSFVDRIIHPEKYPKIETLEGDIFTHKLTFKQEGEKFLVFPLILWDGSIMEEYTREEALRYVKASGQFVSFDTAGDARYFIRKCNSFMGHK